MRHYPSDSPEARARIIALALMADGAIDSSELQLMDDNQTVTRLGIDVDRFDRVFYEFCTDMLNTAQRTSSGQLELDAHTVRMLLDDVKNPVLQRVMLRVMMDIVHADQQLAGGEAVLIAEALKCWSLDLHQIDDTAPRPVRRLRAGEAHRAYV